MLRLKPRRNVLKPWSDMTRTTVSLSAFFRAGASFTPSPVIAITLTPGGAGSGRGRLARARFVSSCDLVPSCSMLGSTMSAQKLPAAFITSVESIVGAAHVRRKSKV